MCSVCIDYLHCQTDSYLALSIIPQIINSVLGSLVTQYPGGVCINNPTAERYGGNISQKNGNSSTFQKRK